jgi:excinuclease ABC subunit B
MSQFTIVSDFQLTGDQPQAVDKLVTGLASGFGGQTLVGVTGCGKTFTIANIIARVQRPALVICHNKTLAAQLVSEFREFFPENAVGYFVSYYDYYQPEAYIPSTDTYIEKETDINEKIDELRHAATRSLFERRDVVIVASVSCIYSLGAPEEYHGFAMSVSINDKLKRDNLIRRLVDMQYERNDFDLSRGKFRVRGDTLEIQPVYEEFALRIEFWGNEISRIVKIDPLTGMNIAPRSQVDIYPAKHFVTSQDKLLLAIEDIKQELQERVVELKKQGKLLEAQRIEARTNYDIEMLQEVGYCTGVENYSRHLQRRAPGSVPWTLLDYFPSDYLLFIDESHMTLPQIRGMYGGDTARKQTLIDYGFRLPSALDNRPLSFEEFRERAGQIIYVSATPKQYEYEHSQQIVEQLIRPTGLLEPTVDVRPTERQIDDLVNEIRVCVNRGERCLVTTLTKRMAEELSDYLLEIDIKTHYLHSEVDTLERIEILRALRLGVYDVVVGINLLREGLDLPEVSMVAILDADKEGYLRTSESLIQTMGRAARHINAHAIMYADSITGSMREAIDEISRRRKIQERYNKEHGITPQGIKKTIKDITDSFHTVAEPQTSYGTTTVVPGEQIPHLIKELELSMKKAAKQLEFEKAAIIRDRIIELRRSRDDQGLL